jgi:hypothetical protein
MEKTEFGFEYELSEGLPPSFVGDYGKIFYAVKAILEGKDKVETTEQEFTVKRVVNLDQFPGALDPVEMNLTQALLFESGQLGMEVNVPKAGFLPGEKIHVSSKLSNETAETVNATLTLMKVSGVIRNILIFSWKCGNNF